MKKKFITILLLIFSFQSLIKAEDIRDFEIEGISIGDSLLLYENKANIEKDKDQDYKSKKYSSFYLNNSENLKVYDGIQVSFLTDDKNYIIENIAGITYLDDFDECLRMKDEISIEISSIFSSAIVNDVGTSKWLEFDETGNTITSQIFFSLDSDSYTDYVEIGCYDWSEKITNEKGWFDNLKVTVNSKKFDKWIVTEAWE